MANAKVVMAVAMVFWPLLGIDIAVARGVMAFAMCKMAVARGVLAVAMVFLPLLGVAMAVAMV